VIALEFIGLTFAGGLLAAVWAGYTVATARKRALAASLWSLGIYGIGCFSVISYTAHHWQAIPLALGDFLGTYITLRYFPDGDTEKAPATGST
jgi:hypothetical protein